MLKADDLWVRLQQNFIFVFTCFHYFRILYSDMYYLQGGKDKKYI